MRKEATHQVMLSGFPCSDVVKMRRGKGVGKGASFIYVRFMANGRTGPRYYQEIKLFSQENPMTISVVILIIKLFLIFSNLGNYFSPCIQASKIGQ